MNGRFKKIEGINYKKGAVDYPDKLAASDRHHLYTKPFYNLAHKVARWCGEGLDEDTLRHFCDFANIAYTLSLPAGATILDVGCGSGWLSEYFVRLGYKVTGVDLSPELIKIARERIASVPFGLDHDKSLTCNFMVHDIEASPFQATFDAILCYDALHHFEDENAVLANLADMLRYGGLLFIAEGERPAIGSQSEAELIAVMEQYQTLESPFERDYLIQLLERHGLAIIGDYTSIPGFLDRDNVSGHNVEFVEPVAFNYLFCKKVGAGPVKLNSKNPGTLRASLTVVGDWQREVAASTPLEFVLRIENTGDTVWLVSNAPLVGRIRLGLKILSESGEVVEEIHGSPRLQRALAPGEEAFVRVVSGAPDTKGNYSLKIDLIDQDICWFEQCGSLPLVLPFIVT
ncbi:MAG TPA: class I SAM-dependent methyltransferase [Pyrinomonadaceae bacterium]|nr:class I SAM-dependent methyltransferase [Pyrinomonadaceae bacterium]